METKNKMNFLKKVKIAIFNLEKYGELITEKLNSSIKYMLILILICTLCFTAIDTSNIYKMIKKATNYITNQMPDFEIKDGEININGEVYGYDEEFDIKILSIDKNNLTDEELQEYKESGRTIILLKDKMILSAYGEHMEYTYNNIKDSLNLDQISKNEIINLYNGKDGNIILTVFTTLFLVYFVSISYETMFNIVIVAFLGYLVSQLGKIKIRFTTGITLAIYSLTLPILLNLIYIVQYNFTKFEIPYFDMLYLVIGYIYIIAAILIIKTDLIKQVMELQKIQNVQPENKEETEQEEKDKKEDKKEKNKDKENKEDNDENEVLNDEPDGSEI